MADKKRKKEPTNPNDPYGKNVYDAKRFKKYREYRNAYVRENLRQIMLRFNRKKPDDLVRIEWLDAKENIATYIKSLIDEDIKRNSDTKKAETDTDNTVE